MRITTRGLEALASEACGGKCLVRLGHTLPWTVNGLAYRDPSGAAVIELHPRIFAWKDARTLAETFWHELGHVKLGHVKALQPSRGTPAAPELAQSIDSATRTAQGREREAAAEAFAAAMGRRVDAADLWRLCID